MKFRIPMWVGLILNEMCTILLIFTPYAGLPFIILYVFGTALASALVMPRKDTLLQLTIDPNERAQINALIMTFTIALASPFGYLVGLLSDTDRRLPFALTFTLFLAAVTIVGRIREPEFSADENEVHA